MYYAKFCAFIGGEADVVLLFKFFDCFPICVADIRPLPLGLKFFKCDLKFVVHTLEFVVLLWIELFVHTSAKKRF